MIHQLIFASPRPGMSEADFQRYWVEAYNGVLTRMALLALILGAVE